MASKILAEAGHALGLAAKQPRVGEGHAEGLVQRAGQCVQLVPRCLLGHAHERAALSCKWITENVAMGAFQASSSRSYVGAEGMAVKQNR